jgi:branched-subunit amino acid aminotransferase/4-amino-4-deoxychorismate lyase
MDKVFLNDGLVDADKAFVPANDGGFLYGAGLFETMRCNNGVVFCLEEHLERLFTSAETLSIFNSFDKKYISDAVYAVLQANGLTDARLRLTLTGGSVSAADEKRKSTLLIAATKLQGYPEQLYQKGILVVLCPYRQNPDEPTCGHKTTSNFSRMLALQDAHGKGAAETLWFTTGNLLAEGCISNVFLVKDSALCTPKLSTPVLPGIARKAVCELAGGNSIKLVEKDLGIDDLLGANEVFLTNVIMKVMSVAGIEKHTVGSGKVGPVTKKMLGLFDDYVKAKCGQKK